MSDAAILVDLGTTNCRVWLTLGEQVLARAQEQVGVRDTARDGSNLRLRRSLRKLIDNVTAEADVKPVAVIAAGMIGSSLGLAEIPHVIAPAGIEALAAATRPHQFPYIAPLPFLLVPGVRTGALTGNASTICQTDIMRGEETLCMGLATTGKLTGRATVINLGSHWKAIEIDDEGRICRSTTSLSGELIHAIQMTTILASALPRERPDHLDPKWLDEGMSQQRRIGLPRALFCVRLMEQSRTTGAIDRFSFLTGVFIGADLDMLSRENFLSPLIPVLLVGHGGLASAWKYALDTVQIPATAISKSEAEKALLNGLTRILQAVEIT